MLLLSVPEWRAPADRLRFAEQLVREGASTTKWGLIARHVTESMKKAVYAAMASRRRCGRPILGVTVARGALSTPRKQSNIGTRADGRLQK